MRKQTLSTVVAALAAIFVSAAPLNAAVPSRIGTSLNDGNRVSIANSVHPKVRLSEDLGGANGEALLTDMAIRFNMSDAQAAALAQLEIDQQNPQSARYHQWLTPEQFGAQFGMSDADLATVSNWLASQGLTVTGTAHSKTFISFSGSVSAVQKAFGVSMHSLSLNGEKHIANVNEVMLPAGLRGAVTGITGLHDFKLQSRAKVTTVPAPAAHGDFTTNFTSSISGNHFIAPGDFYTIYDTTPLLTTSINGTGITIAVMGQTDISLTDVAAFRTASGLASNPPTVKLYGTDPGTSAGDLPEAQLDVEWSGAVAPSAAILYVNSKDVIGISMTQAIDNNLAPIITISYGDCEAGWGQANLTTYNALFQQATVQGITLFGPSGDSGATDCDYQVSIATQGLAVDFPASSPYVTGLGGTMYNEGSGTYWNATNNANSGSAVSYIPEGVWNESVSGSGVVGGGGGISAFFSKPTWQTGTGVPADVSRDVPDISLNAAAGHDGYLFCVSGFCTNGYRNSANSLDVVGGTSVSTPAFAGIMALVEQKLGGGRLGNINPTLYALANSTYYNNVFHDVTTGTNATFCSLGSKDCPAGGVIGYSATTGYDLATGWGSVDAFNLATKWSLVTPLPIGGQTPSVTTLTGTPVSVNAGTNVTLTAMVVSGSTSTTTVPTGSVQFLLDRVPVGSPVALASGTANYTLSTTGLASGSHTVGVSYAGNTTFAGSKGALLVNVTSATAADFTLTPSNATITVASGKTASGVTFTVTGVNSFAGTVYFCSATSSTTLANSANDSFSVTSLPLSTTVTSGTTTYTLFAFLTQGGKSGPLTLASAEPQPRMPNWYTTGGGIAVAGLLMLVLPKRRRMSGLLVALMAVAAFGVSGCSNGVLAGPTTVNTPAGSYTITITAQNASCSSTPTIAHSSQIAVTVQ